MMILAFNASQEMARQFKSAVVTQCATKLGPTPVGAVEGYKWNYKQAVCVANGVADKDRPFWKRWAEGRRRDLEAREWQEKNRNPGGRGPSEPNPIQYDGLVGYKQGTCQACMP